MHDTWPSGKTRRPVATPTSIVGRAEECSPDQGPLDERDQAVVAGPGRRAATRLRRSQRPSPSRCDMPGPMQAVEPSLSRAARSHDREPATRIRPWYEPCFCPLRAFSNPEAPHRWSRRGQGILSTAAPSATTPRRSRSNPQRRHSPGACWPQRRGALEARRFVRAVVDGRGRTSREAARPDPPEAPRILTFQMTALDEVAVAGGSTFRSPAA